MTLTIDSVASVSSCSHYQIQFTFGGQTRTLHTSREDFQQDLTAADEEAIRLALIILLRGMVRAAGASTLGQVKNALEGKTIIL
jgi:hypothetical protein